MYSNYRFKLFLVLLILAMTVTFTVTTFDYLRLKEQILTENEVEIKNVSRASINALRTVDKIYELLDPEIAKEMEKGTNFLLEKYRENNDFNTWDFTSLAEQLAMDIYILDEQNVVQYSNVEREVGLDFEICCKSLNQTLHERRSSGDLYIDEIDINQYNNQVKKFSYQATDDQKYLIELGYNLENEAIFQHFNFIHEIEEIIEQSSIVHAIHVLNFGGYAYGGKEDVIPDERAEIFQQVRETDEPIEIETTYKDEDVFIQYIPVHSIYDQSKTSFKVLEIIYEDEDLNPFFMTNIQEFTIQVIIVSVFTLLVSSLIANWFSKPVYYAYHDSLTKLKNRTAFDDMLDDVFAEKSEQYVLFVLDLDNFKLVNDELGHAKGDKLLRKIGRRLNHCTIGDSFRIGGDEFAIVREIDEAFQVDSKAQFILNQLNDVIQQDEALVDLSISVSIGIAYTTEWFESKEAWYKQADAALYEAKEKGKNQYQIYPSLANENYLSST